MPFCAYCGSPVAETSYRLCPACGNPANGAPRPSLATGGSNSLVIAIVAIVLALLAIPAAGIVAAIAIPNVLTAVQRSKQKRTIQEIRELALHLEQQAGLTGSYPGTLSERKQDGWGRELRYECLADGDRPCAGYALTSAGKDGAFEFESGQHYPQGTTTKFDCDIVFSSGQFVQSPEGVQR